MSTLSSQRTGRITGSRIAKILELSPYGTRDSVMREMVRQHHGAEDEFTGNVATEYGNEHEADAIAQYEAERFVDLHGAQQLVIHPQHDFLAVTPDGLVDVDGMVEAKCPYRAPYRHVDERPDYEAQIRLQLECTRRLWCDFVVWVEGEGIYVSRVKHDPDWLPSVLPDLLAFMEEYHEIIADPDRSAPYLEPLKDARTDDVWTEAALAWAEADMQAKLADERAKKLRQELLNLTDKPAVGAGVQVVRQDRRGSVDYSRFVKDQKLDVPDDYRRAGSTVWQVRRAAS